MGSETSRRSRSKKEISNYKLTTREQDGYEIVFYTYEDDDDSPLEEYSDTTDTYDGYFRQKRVKSLRVIMPGDHVAWQRVWGYFHHAIVTSVDRNAGKLTVIEYGMKTDGNQIFCCVRETEKTIVSFNTGLYRFVYDPAICYTPDEVIARAKSRLGECKFNILTNNTEHFATWCKCEIQSVPSKNNSPFLRRVGVTSVYAMTSHDFNTNDAVAVLPGSRQKDISNKALNFNQTSEEQDMCDDEDIVVDSSSDDDECEVSEDCPGTFDHESSYTRKERVMSWDMITAGDHVAWQRDMGYWHHAILISVEPGKSKFTNIGTKAFRGAQEKQETIENFNKVFFYRYEYNSTSSYAPQEVIERARSRLGDRKYNILTNNCQHFATWCKVKTGGRCSQILPFFGRVGLWSLSFFTGPLVCLVVELGLFARKYCRLKKELRGKKINKTEFRKRKFELIGEIAVVFLTNSIVNLLAGPILALILNVICVPTSRVLGGLLGRAIHNRTAAANTKED